MSVLFWGYGGVAGGQDILKKMGKLYNGFEPLQNENGLKPLPIHLQRLKTVAISQRLWAVANLPHRGVAKLLIWCSEL